MLLRSPFFLEGAEMALESINYLDERGRAKKGVSEDVRSETRASSPSSS